jgi:flagellar basal body rod protein FlgB
MHISLDNISFYSHPPPAKSLPVSCWKPYETPLAPRALSHGPLPRLPSSRTECTLLSNAWQDACAGFRTPATEDPDLGGDLNEFDLEIERIAMVQNSQVTHEADLCIHSQHTSLDTGM